MKILIAEKKNDLYLQTSEIFFADGVEVLSCNTAEGLVQFAKKTLPFVIIVGVEFSKDEQLLINSIRSEENLKEIPILFVCKKDAEKKKVLDLIDKGVHDILTMPLDINELLSRIKVFKKLDLTQRKNRDTLKLLDQLNAQLSKEHLNSIKIMELMPVGIIIYNEDLTLEFMNHDAELLTGYQFSYLKDKSIESVYSQLKFQEKFDDIIRLQGELYCRDTLVNRHERKISIERKCLNITGKENKIISRVDVFRDITTANELELLMEARIEERSQGVIATQNITMMALASLAESRDNETGMHLERMRTYSKMIAQDLLDHHIFPEVTVQFVNDIFSSSPLHDIGKVGTPDYVLLKPGKLTVEEWEIMKMHPVIGAKTLEDAINQGAHATFLEMAKDICLGHHEKFDGSGYPKGAVGNNIPLSARIVALADCYDALRSTRIYKKAFNHEESKQLILEKSGVFYDPFVIESFVRIEQKIIEAAEKFRDEDESENDKTDISSIRR